MAGTNYGGGGWKEGCGVRWFRGMGERWKIDGRRRGGCEPGMPGPYGGGGRVSGCWPGTGRRRGQDPSLRCGVRRGV